MDPTYPQIGLYVDPVDYDGDGDLDLLVGGCSQVPPFTNERGRKRTRRPFVWLYRRID